MLERGHDLDLADKVLDEAFVDAEEVCERRALLYARRCATRGLQPLHRDGLPVVHRLLHEAEGADAEDARALLGKLELVVLDLSRLDFLFEGFGLGFWVGG